MTFNETRQAICSTIYTLHTTNYPAVPIVMPNQKELDLENIDGPFVELQIEYDKSEQLQIGAKCTKTSGQIILHYNVREHKGLKSSFEYTDFLVANVGLQTINEVIYREVIPSSMQEAMGWVTVMNFIPFRVFNIT